MKKILMIATGGTIASRRTPQGLTPLMTSEEVLRFVPGVGQLCQVEAIQLFNLDSTNITPKHWLEMAAAIEAHYPDYDGFVLCHGTDTMACTAATLSYLIQRSPKPIVVTGAQRPIDLEITDAKQNLLDSFLYACHPGASGVQIVFDGKVIAGTRAKKTRTKSYNAFSSINFPYLALLQDGRVIQYLREQPAPQPVFYHTLDPKIGLCKLIPGAEASLLRFYLENYDGVMIESFGLGGLPQGEDFGFFREIDRFAGEGKTIVMTTQVQSEGSDLSIYQVGKLAKQRHRMLETYDMTLEAAVTKLMWILGQTRDPEAISRLFYTPVGHDLSFFDEAGFAL